MGNLSSWWENGERGSFTAETTERKRRKKKRGEEAIVVVVFGLMAYGLSKKKESKKTKECGKWERREQKKVENHVRSL